MTGTTQLLKSGSIRFAKRQEDFEENHVAKRQSTRTIQMPFTAYERSRYWKDPNGLGGGGLGLPYVSFMAPL